MDDDHNGYVDDLIGWDFVFDSPDPDCHVFDGMDKTRIATYSHGLGVMGIIGAKGNNGIGVAGINWDVSMMLLKIGAQGVGRGEVDSLRPERAAKAIRYAVDNGARIINWSGFVDNTDPKEIQTLREAIAYAGKRNVLIVVGAGNGASDLDTGENCKFPQCFDEENLVRVAGIDFQGKLFQGNLLQTETGSRFVFGSDFGLKRVEIAAIEFNYTTVIQGGIGTYVLGEGTSCAAPVVAGFAALMLSVNPKLTATQLKKLLMESVTKLPTLEGKVASGGMVNAYRAVLAGKNSSN